ncbi:hypothetical protein R3P38DRAFT_3115314 [Favolaschia claudopus]|uniref:Uncharacterized protein n=1 Tax=Favolaschia claudopus TaxID=2862362 RepID=A0AAV9ZGJ5_9AGAR
MQDRFLLQTLLCSEYTRILSGVVVALKCSDAVCTVPIARPRRSISDGDRIKSLSVARVLYMCLLHAMHFSPTFPAFIVLAFGAIFQAAAAPNANVDSSSLTRRNWCGYERSCSCTPNTKTGCKLTLDKCSGQFYWPTTCTGCDPCVEACVDFFTCLPQAEAKA